MKNKVIKEWINQEYKRMTNNLKVADELVSGLMGLIKKDLKKVD